MTPHNIYRFELSGTTHITTLESYAAAINADVESVLNAARETRHVVPSQEKSN